MYKNNQLKKKNKNKISNDQMPKIVLKGLLFSLLLNYDCLVPRN